MRADIAMRSLGLTLVKCSGTCTSAASASRMPLAHCALNSSQRVCSTHLLHNQPQAPQAPP